MKELDAYDLNMGVTDLYGPIFLISFYESDCSLSTFEINS